jgi:hypothetical protein
MSDSSLSERSSVALTQGNAVDIIESLRLGKPPRRGVRAYSVGHEEFLRSVRLRHLEGPSGRGKIRFISGSWGSGKSHFLRELREEAFETNYLVGLIDLAKEETPFNRFERVFASIVSRIASPEMFFHGNGEPAAPFADVLRRTLLVTGGAEEAGREVVPHEVYSRAAQKLMSNESIDIDFRRMVVKYWESYLPEGGDQITLIDRRNLILQWFGGEGTIGTYRREFGVQKIVARDTARLMLKSLGRFAVHAGYRGLTILFDEAEMSYSVMRRSDLKSAHNNLLHLINGVDESEGLFLVYATTPDFYTDPKHGIQNYGALASRIGKPSDSPPKALDKIWNFDAVQQTTDEYKNAALKVRELYLSAFPDAEPRLSSPEKIKAFVDELTNLHPALSPVRFWRVLVANVVAQLDRENQQSPAVTTEQLYDETLERLREDG